MLDLIFFRIDKPMMKNLSAKPSFRRFFSAVLLYYSFVVKCKLKLGICMSFFLLLFIMIKLILSLYYLEPKLHDQLQCFLRGIAVILFLHLSQFLV